MIEKKILKMFTKDKEHFLKYYKYINLDYIKNNYSNIYRLFRIVDTYYDKYDTTSISLEELDVTYNANYKLNDGERKDLNGLLTDIYDTPIVNEENVVELMDGHRKRCLSGEVARIALDVEDGRANIEDLQKVYNEFDSAPIDEDTSTIVNMDLATLHKAQVVDKGLRWRLNWLNKSLGSLRKGDFGFIMARPETGKTTFLASEVSHMVQQTEGDVIWFNNEEQGGKVAIRCFQAMLGLQTEPLFNNIEENQEKFNALGGNRIKILDYDDSSSSKRIEAVLKNSNPSLIVFDQIDKIKGFKADRNDLELKAIYQWARELAKKYAPVIAVSQAGGSGEGKLFLTMDDVDGSKTGKQGEADFILGIGKEQDNTSNMRYFNITKNKLIGDEDTLPDLRHGNTQVLMKPEIARYMDT